MTKSWIAKGALFAAAVLLSLFQLGLFWHRMDAELTSLADNQPDQAPWALGQVEVEYHRLLSSIEKSNPEQIVRETVNERFAIFHSRIVVLEQSRSFAEHRDVSTFYAPLAHIRAFLSANRDISDLTDSEFAARLPEFRHEAALLAPNIRQLAVNGFHIAIDQMEERRDNAHSIVLWHAVQTGLLLVLLFILVAGLWRLERIRRKAHKEATVAQAEIEAIVNSATDAVILCTETGQITDVNPAGREIFGLGDINVMTLRLNRLLMSTTSTRDYKSPTHSGFFNRERVTTSAMKLDGSTFPAEVSLVRVETDGATNIYVAYVRDVTKRTQNEMALRKAHDEARANEKAKSDLLAVMSHETRTPLNGILGAAELLKKSITQERELKLVDALETSARVLLKHVNNVLDVSRMDAGKTDLVIEQFDLQALISEVVKSQTAAAAKKNVEIVADTGSDQPIRVVGDAQKLGQVVLNLVSNAVKFTTSGQIIIELEKLDEGEFFEIRVMDTGAGIETRKLQQIFEDYYTGSDEAVRSKESTGLGLAIVKRMVTAMGGEVGAESVLGEGSLFWVRVPLRQENASLSDVTSETPAAGLRILLVDDNAINRLVTKEMLSSSGHSVFEAEDGLTAITAAKREEFNLIFMDINMPDMDGIETTKRIRAGSGPSAKTPIVALTAYSQSDRMKCIKAAGIRDVMTKPILESALEAMILKVTGDIFLSGLSRPTPQQSSNTLEEEIISGALNSLGSEQLNANFQTLTQEMKQLFDELENITTADALDLDELHRLTGSTGVMGLMKLRAHLAYAETIELADPGDLQLWIKELKSLWENAERAFLHRLKTSAVS